MKILFFVTTLFFFIWAIRNILFWVSLWQIKEYRFDRVFIHLFETMQGRQLVFSYLNVLKVLILLSFGFVMYDRLTYLLPFQIAVASIFFLQILVVEREVVNRVLKRPVFTIKSLIITGLALALVILLFQTQLITEEFFWLLLIDKLIAMFIGFFVLVFALPTEFHRDYVIEKAIAKMGRYTKASWPQSPKKFSAKDGVLVIGITGSYGKSSTKEYMAQILSKKFTVLKTQGTNNTPIGIANTILRGLNQEIEIFVVEMGAYKVGEIAALCQIVKPVVGVLTAVSDQHLSLFGSLEKTMQAKFELIESLPDDGFALFNGNNPNATTLFHQTKVKKTLSYAQYAGTTQKPPVQSGIQARNIRMQKDQISFDVTIKNKTIHLSTPLLGVHNVENILPGVLIAHSLGMTDNDIKKAVSSLAPVGHTMMRHSLPNGVTIIDDTFNANPLSALAALSYMKGYKGKKVMVLQPMIELGKQARLDHYRMGKEIASVCDVLFLTNKNFYKDMMKGIKESKHVCDVRIVHPNEAADYITLQLEEEDVVVCEGKEAARVFNTLF